MEDNTVIMPIISDEEEWFTLDDIQVVENSDPLYCIAVDSPDKCFLIGEINAPTHNTEEGKADDALKGEAAMIIGSIARLGRAAGVHLVIATQRPDATTISGETKANLGVRINAGRTDPTASSMILGTGEGARVKSNPRGRLYLRIFGSGNHGQGFFAAQSWIDDYLKSKGLNPDGSPISSPRSRLANVTDMSKFEEADLDTMTGVDNSSIIENIREKEAQGDFSSTEEAEDGWGFEDGDDGDFGQEASSMPEPSMGRPEFGVAKDNSKKFHRSEDDWDDDLDDLIAENNS